MSDSEVNLEDSLL